MVIEDKNVSCYIISYLKLYLSAMKMEMSRQEAEKSQSERVDFS